MARVFRRPASALSRRAPSRAARANSRKHKVIMESVTQKKKKLRSVISFEAKAPPGYTFIPAGNPQLTTACKELCRKDGLKVFAVTTTPHMHTHNLSQHVHRIGYHFPSTVVATVCMDLGLYLTASGKTIPFHGGSNAGNRKRTNSEVSQITINTEARDVLKDLFPNIPTNDLNQIIKTAFQKGQRKVGTAVELPLARRAQLAVVAHIRHLYTDYDRLLKTTSFHEARSTVEEPTLARLVEWRGDDENGKTVLEDVFREVIVISDDEDSDAEGDVPPSVDRDYSVEVVSSNPRIDELQTKPVNYTNPVIQDSHLDASDDDAPPGFRFVPGVPKKKRIDRRGFSRYQAWDRAMNRYRNTAIESGAIVSRGVNNGPTHNTESLSAVRQPLLESSHIGMESAPNRHFGPCSRENPRPITPNPRPRDSRVSNLVPSPTLDRHVSLQSSPTKHISQLHTMSSAGINDLLTLPEPNELYPVTQPSRQTLVPGCGPKEHGRTFYREKGSFRRGGSPNAPVFVSGPRDICDPSRGRIGLHNLPVPLPGQPISNPQDRILPSIEVPSSTNSRRPDNGTLDHITRRMSGGFSIRSVTPHRLPPNDSPQQAFEDKIRTQAPKRRRMDFCEPSKPLGFRSDIDFYAAVEPHTGERHPPSGYLPPGHLSIQDQSHVHRLYVPSANPRSFANPHSGGLQGSFSNVSQPNTDLGITMHQRHAEDPERHPISHGRLPAVRNSPGQSHDLTDPRPALSMDKIYRRTIPVQPSGPGERHAYNPGYHYDVDCIQSSEFSRPLGPSVRTRTNRLALHETHRKRHYADGFVRTIDLHDPIPSKYPPQCPLQTSSSVEGPAPPAFAQPDEDRYGSHLPGEMTSRPASHLKSAAHGHVLMEDDSPRYHSGRPSELETGAPYYGGGHEDHLNHRRAYRQHIQSYPAPTGGEEQSQSHYSLPRGQAVVIVD